MKAGWQTKALGELCQFQRGLTYAKADEVSFSENIVLRANNIDLESNALNLSDLRFISDSVQVPADKKLRKGSLLICTASGSKSHLGKVAFVDDDYGYAFGGFMGQITPTADMEGRYLFYALTSPGYKYFIAALSDGANINNLKFNDLRRFSVSVPHLAEQRRIASILDEAFESIATAKANAEKNLQNARELFDNALQSLLRDSNGDRVLHNMAAVCDIPSKLVDPREETYQDLPHVGAGNIEAKTGVLIDVLTARQEQLISGKFLFDESMVLYSKIRPYLMKVVRPDFSGLCSADIYPLAATPGVITRDYLFYVLLSPEFTEYAIKGSARAGMPKVNREHLFAYELSLPSVQEQERIAATLDGLAEETQRLIAVYERKLADLDELKKSLLHQAFNGQL